MNLSTKKIGNIFTWNTLALVVIGILCLLSASMILAKTEFNDPYYYVKQQLVKGVLIGVIGFLITFFIPYKVYKKLSPLIFVLAIILVILLFTPLGLEINGARRWLDLGFISFQPNEILKIAFIMYLSFWLSQKTPKEKNSFGTVIAFIVFLGLVGFLMISQPATSAFFILAATAFIIYFLSGIKIHYLFLTILIIGILLVGGFLGLKKFYPDDYRLVRISSFLNSEQNMDISGKDYQVNQSIMAIGSGGLSGVGFGNAVSKYNNYLPEPIGDSIFAIIAQEFGLLGGVGLILMYLGLLIEGFQISKRCSDEFGKLLSFGIVVLPFIQMIVHIGALTKIFPLTGQPLPFISYGGTNLAILLTSFGIVVNISKYS
jgi:cell division protein FtsW